MIEVDTTLRGMIHDGAGEQTMEQWCRQKSPGLFDDGIKKVCAGETSLAEVLRVTRAS